MDREKDTGAPAGGGLKRFLPSMKGALGRSRRPLVAIVLIVLVFGLGYALFVRERLRQVQERHLRLLGNAADKLERVLDITKENGDNLILDLTSLPTFLRQNPYVDLQGRADPAVLARSLSEAAGGASTRLVSEGPGLELQIVGLDEQGREARIADDRVAREILGRLEATGETRLEPQEERDSAEGDLVAVVERLEVDLALDWSDLPLEPRPLSRDEIDPEEPALLVRRSGDGEAAPATVDRRHFMLSAAAAQPSQIEISKGLRVEFGGSTTEELRAVFSGGELRVLGARQVLRAELELTAEQRQRLGAPGAAELGLEAKRAQCGFWVFQDGRPLERIDGSPVEERGWSRAEASRRGKYLYVRDGDPLDLGFFQRARIPEKGLKAGSFCPAELRADDDSLSLTLEQQRHIEILLRDLERKGPGQQSYEQDLEALEVRLNAADDPAPARLQLTASFRAAPILLSLPPSARAQLQLGVTEAEAGGEGSSQMPMATLLHLGAASHGKTATFLLSISATRQTEDPVEELARVPILADERQRRLLQRISEVPEPDAEQQRLGAVGPSFELARVGTADRGSYRLNATARIAHPRIPLEMVDGHLFDATGPARLDGTLGVRTGADWRLRLGGGEKSSGERLTFSIDLESVLASARLDAAFTNYFLVDEGGQILFQRRPAAVARVHGARRVRHRSGVRFRELEPVKSGGAGAPAGGDDNSKSADTKANQAAEAGLRLTCQPALLQLHGGAKVWRLCGQVDRSAAISEALGSTPYVTFGLLAVVLLGGLSIPFLRFVLMARNERLRRGDILMLLAGTWVALSIVAVVPAALHRHDVLESVLVGQMRRLADRVSDNVAANLRASRALLGELDAMATGAFDCAWLDASPVPQQVRLLEDPQAPRLGLYPANLRQRPVSPFTSVFWVDGEGRQIAKGTVGPENTPAVPVGHRSYVRAVVEDRPWTARLRQEGDPAEGVRPWLFFDTFLSITTGERSAALSMPSGLSVRASDSELAPLESCGASGSAAAVLTGLPPALRAPVVSEPLGFAVIDARGTTLFHSQPGLALASNFLDDIGKPGKLAAALVSRTPRLFDATYQSRPHSLFVRPLFADGSLPGERPGWWIVTFYDKELPRTIVSEAVLQSLVPTLSTGLLLGLLLFVFRRRVLRDLWPTVGETDHYVFLGAIYLVVVLVQLVALFSPSVTASPVLLAVLYTLLPVAVLLGSSLLLHRERAKVSLGAGGGEQSANEAPSDPAEAAPAAGFMARAGARIRRFVDWVAGFMVRAGAWIRRLVGQVAGWLQPGRVLARRTWGGIERLGGTIKELGHKSIFSERDSLAYVGGMILLWVLLAVLPTLGFFNNAWTRELNVLLEHDALMTLEELAGRRAETSRYLARSDLDDPATLASRLAGRDDLYLFSAGAELLGWQQETDFLQRVLSEPTVGARAIHSPIGRTDRVLSDFLPIYNRASQSLRYLGAGQVRGFVLSGDTLQLTLPESARQLVGGVDDYVSLITSNTPPSDLRPLVVPMILLLLLLGVLATWVWYTANHICFSRVEVKRGEDLEDLVEEIRHQAGLAWVEPVAGAAAASSEAGSSPDADVPVQGFVVVVTSRQHYQALQALGDARDLCAIEDPASRSSGARRWGLQRRPRAAVEETTETRRAIVICKRFEAGIEDRANRKRKLATLRALIKSPLELPVLLCPRDPREILRPAMPGGTTAATAGPKRFELDEEAAAIWSAVLHGLEPRHLALTLPPAGEDESMREEDYWIIWSNCSEHERLAMVQLAAEGLLNPKQADAVASLGKRGIVEIKPTLKFTDPGLREFVSRFKKSPHFRDVERAARSAGWGGRRWLLSTVVVVAAVFLFLTKPELFSATLAILTATAAAIPAFLNLLGSAGGARRADG